MTRSALGFVTTAVLASAAAAALAFGQEARDDVAEAPPNVAPSADVAPSTPATPYTPYPSTPDDVEAEREEIWDSPEMLRARAWLREYTARSAQITPAQAKEYMAELERMTPMQMKLWLLKFQEQREMTVQQQAAVERGRQTAVGNAMRVNQQTEQAEANIDQGSTLAAETARESLAAQWQAAQARSQQLASDRDAAATEAMRSDPYVWANTLPWGPYAGYPLNGPHDPGARFGHYHYHYHAPQAGEGEGEAPTR